MELLDLLFSRNCKLCGKRIKTGAVCDVCDVKLRGKITLKKRVVHTDFERIDCVCLFNYSDSLVKKLLRSLKTDADKELFKYAAGLYSICCPKDFDGAVSYIPRRRENVRKFSYDQVEVPLRIMAKSKALRFYKLFKRRGFSKDQKNLNKQKREQNIHGKFRLIKKDIPKNILLADDVLTTASTFKECASLLLSRDGSVKITGIFIASSDGFSGKGQFEY